MSNVVCQQEGKTGGLLLPASSPKNENNADPAAVAEDKIPQAVGLDERESSFVFESLSNADKHKTPYIRDGNSQNLQEALQS